jgi:paraquat-inducible protein B
MTDALPAATIRRRRWRFPVVWVVPVVAAIVAGYLVYGHLQELGPTITITFNDVDGVKPDQTEIRYRGVVVGQVTRIELSEDHQHAVVKARLRRAESSIARDGSLFWIVRPEVTMWTIRGLSTVITGPYIQVSPGTGPPTSEFTGLEGAPPSGRPGLRITLATAQLRSLGPGSPVYYRGIEVGAVTATTLSRDATAAHVHVVIEPRYARLVRLGSRFWTVSGVDVNVGLFRGVEINLEALKSLIAGGVAFASPEDPTAPPVKDGTIFALHDKPEKQWLEWMPKIPIPAAK